jgi:hypothetical protein
LIENLDYYINDEGFFVFTEKHHLERGYCCKNQCKHCPWKYKKKDSKAINNTNKESRYNNNGN